MNGDWIGNHRELSVDYRLVTIAGCSLLLTQPCFGRVRYIFAEHVAEVSVEFENIGVIHNSPSSVRSVVSQKQVFDQIDLPFGFDQLLIHQSLAMLQLIVLSLKLV